MEQTLRMSKIEVTDACLNSAQSSGTSRRWLIPLNHIVQLYLEILEHENAIDNSLIVM